MTDTRTRELPIEDAREIVKPLRTPKPLVYWTDFLGSVALGWTAFTLAVVTEPWTLPQLAGAAVAPLALYRALIFIHELAHLRKGTFRTFRLVWNLLCGFPMMVPSFTYHGVHNGHHKRDVYGTTADGEYVPFGAQPPREIVKYLLLVFVLPLLFLGRFVVLTPISFIHPRLRKFAWERASSLTIDLGYRRPPPATFGLHWTWRLQELATAACGISAVALVATGTLPYRVLVLWYATTAVIVLFNSLRTLAAHAYRNPGNQPMTLTEQFTDSVDVPGTRFITALWAPVGLRFHATHHLFPSLPYHALAEAHRRLVRELPDPTIYKLAIRTSLWDALRRLWSDAQESADPAPGLAGRPR